MRFLLVSSALTCAALCSGCGADAGAKEEPRCLDEKLNLECQAAFAPTFDGVFDNVLNKTCASVGTSCHGPNGRQGGLQFGEPGSASPDAKSMAYDLLTGAIDGRRRVESGDPECSKLVVRLESDGEPWGMPPGDPVPDSVKCAIRQWVAQGATR